MAAVIIITARGPGSLAVMCVPSLSQSVCRALTRSVPAVDSLGLILFEFFIKIPWLCHKSPFISRLFVHSLCVPVCVCACVYTSLYERATLALSSQVASHFLSLSRIVLSWGGRETLEVVRP